MNFYNGFFIGLIENEKIEIKHHFILHFRINNRVGIHFVFLTDDLKLIKK